MPERIERRYLTELDVSDGRSIIGRCVPFDDRALVADGDGTPYYEIIRRGAFRNSLRAARAGRYRLVYEHSTDLANVIGPAVELVERDDGLHGTFRALDGTIGDHALELVRSGTCTGLSITARTHERGTRILDDGTVERSLLSLEHVALTAEPAYAGAGVTAVRNRGDLDAPPPLIARALARSELLRAKSFR
jgi:HK97 family phage prohead protease